MRRTVLTALAGTTGLLAAALVPTALAPIAAAADTPSPCGTTGAYTPLTCTYSAAGTDTFTVPDGVTSVTVDLFGAEGGSAAGYVSPNPQNDGAPGGLGGESRATLAVRPGEQLQLTLGAAGIPGTSRHGEFARPGGYGHGTGGGGAHGGGGSGGGGSDVRTGAFGAADRVLVAGGGGGAGNGGPLLHGGAGGGPVAEDGGQGGGPDGSGVAGGGGSQTAPGAGSPNSALGGPGTPGGDTDMWTGLPNPGSGGTGGNGARGGNGGGGGGGGWKGGAGGSGGGNPGNLYGAGGGGGSSWAAPAATDVALLRGVNQGGGRATVSFRYDTATTLTTDRQDPLFGHPVTLTATVSPTAAGNPAATGTVTFTEGATVLATVPLTDGRASWTTSRLRPGQHPVTAAYSGDPGHRPSSTAQPLDLTVGFSAPCLTTTHQGPLAVGADEARCLAPGATQHGPVTVAPGGALVVLGADLDGPLISDGALALTACGSTLHGPLTVRGTSGQVLLGSAADDCAGNTVTAPVRLTDNTGPVLLDGDTIGGPLRCEGNSAQPVVTGTTVSGPRSGQCR